MPNATLSFLIELSPAARTEQLSGRIEHLWSGHSLDFLTAEAAIDFMARTIARTAQDAAGVLDPQRHPTPRATAAEKKLKTD